MKRCALGGSLEEVELVKTNRASPNASLVVPLSTSMIEIMFPRRLTWESPYWRLLYQR